MKNSLSVITLNVLFLFVMTILTGCAPTYKEPDGTSFRFQGTVKYIDIEGGFYGIVSENGDRYNPLDMPPSFKVDGLRVQVTARKSDDVATIMMWGTPVHIVDIERLD